MHLPYRRDACTYSDGHTNSHPHYHADANSDTDCYSNAYGNADRETCADTQASFKSAAAPNTATLTRELNRTVAAVVTPLPATPEQGGAFSIVRKATRKWTRPQAWKPHTIEIRQMGWATAMLDKQAARCGRR
jgi:hypothetical protein